jgi:peroxiredoxin
VQILSIALDNAEQQAAARAEYGIQSPMLIDADAAVSTAYDVMQWASGTGEPGHTFVLVNKFGHLAWLRDYGAAANGGTMYVPVDELVAAVDQSLEASEGH